MKRLSSSWFAVSCLVFASGCAQETAPELTELTDAPVNQFAARRDAVILPDGGNCASVTITPESELMIRDLLVVEDPIRTNWSGNPNPPNPSDGAWHFGRLMTQMAGTNDPEQFVRTWLQEWSTPRPVNGFVVPPRNIDALVVNPWLAASGGTRLDLTRAPFRLLAIVNRIDLRDLARGSAGEGRFVFGVLGAGGAQLQFTVILEYNLPASTPADVRRWADDFHALSSLPRGSAQYNQALENITTRFAGRDVAPTRPNGSSINQVRSNEIALLAPWELREFKLNAAGQLRQVTVAQTTDLTFDNSPTLANFINANTPALLAGTHVVPATFNGAPFLGGSAITNPNMFWRAPGVTNNEARFRFSINTCNGCHAGETGTPFLHVSPRNLGQVAALSTFLTGKTQPDPVSGLPRTFNDLDFRSSSLGEVLCDSSSAAVSVTAPTAGATVRGNTTLSASATGFDFVEFRIDGNFIGTAPPPAFTMTWNAETVPPGPHTLTAVGIRPSGPVSSAPVAITVAPLNGPDFIVSAFNSPSAMLPGSQFTAQVTVCNQGNQFGSAPVDVVVSRDSTFRPFTFPNDDLLLGGQPVSLSPGQCQTLNINVTANLPPPPPPGTPPSNLVFLGAIVDGPGFIIELDKTNNSSVPKQVAFASGPDFSVSVAAPPSSTLPNTPFNLVATVCNVGTSQGTPQMEAVLSTDATLSLPTDFIITQGFTPLPNLMPTQCATVTLKAQVFQPQGSFFVGVVVDPFNSIPELFENNNSSVASPLAVGSGPDFRVSTITVPTAVTPGASFNASVTVCNAGTAFGTGSVQLEVGGLLTGISPPLNLQPGQCLATTVNSFASVPVGVTPVLARVVNVSPLELVTTNNTATQNLVVGTGPDFTVSVSTASPLNVAPGANFTVTATVCNRGTVSGSTNVDVVLSNDAVLEVRPPNPPDQLMGGTFVTLAPNACTNRSFSVPAPGPGTFFVGALVDAFNGLVELVETNNASAAVRLAVGSQPDFVISALTLPSSAMLGQSFTANATVCNRGTLSGNTAVELRRSFDATIDLNDMPLGIGAPVTLAVGQCVTQSINGFADSPTGGPIFIGALADVFNGTLELDETNNSRVGTLLVGNQADFTVTIASAPSLVALNSSFSVLVQTCNRGTQPGSANVDLLRSPDTFFLAGNGSNDVLVGGASVTLNAGQCNTRVFTVFAGGVRTTFHLAAVVDPFNSVTELSETNNQSAVRTITVQ